ncbi:MAG TPA: ATP-binding cassette domain-containing protein [Solirubrobacteraceae bacterium]|nr:ATP-binding cassette domain-containing protein [Solirubrobacteraceae bacterium]
MRQVTKRYVDGRCEIVVLDGVSLEIDGGDFVGVWGPMRSGKSTLLRVMSGIEQPDSGEVRFDGRALRSMSARGRARQLRAGGIGLVSSEWRTQIVRPTIELVATACASDGTPMREARILARKALARVSATDCADVRTDRLTLGERLRAALAMALVREPRLLLVDEPAVLPSPLESNELFALLRSLGEERDLAVVIASENLAALSGTLRTMAVSGGEVRSMDQDGVIVPFPSSPASRAPRAGDALP